MIPSSILIYSLISLTLHGKCKNPSLKPHINCFKTTLNKTTTHSINQLKLILASKFLHFLCNQPFPLLSSNLANNLQLIYETKAKEKKALSWTEETRLLHETNIEESNTIQYIGSSELRSWEETIKSHLHCKEQEGWWTKSRRLTESEVLFCGLFPLWSIKKLEEKGGREGGISYMGKRETWTFQVRKCGYYIVVQLSFLIFCQRNCIIQVRIGFLFCRSDLTCLMRMGARVKKLIKKVDM